MTIPAGNEAAKVDLMKATKAELAEMYRSTFRPAARPTLAVVLAERSKSHLADILLRIGGLDA